MSTTTDAALSSIWAAVHSPSGLFFPDTIRQLAALGVTRYRVDFLARHTTSYFGAAPGTCAPQPITIAFPSTEEYTPGAWNKEGVVAAIRGAQAGERNYLWFSGKVVESGVADYTVYFRGQRVVYMGADGDVHVEWFPGAGPKKD